MNAIPAILGLIVTMVVGSIIKGLALSVLWGWFMVPIFDLPELAIAPAIGLALIASYLTHQHDHAKDEDEESFGTSVLRSFLYSILMPLWMLLIGWIVHQFM
jgi:hypothetical protein